MPPKKAMSMLGRHKVTAAESSPSTSDAKKTISHLAESSEQTIAESKQAESKKADMKKPASKRVVPKKAESAITTTSRDVPKTGGSKTGKRKSDGNIDEPVSKRFASKNMKSATKTSNTMKSTPLRSNPSAASKKTDWSMKSVAELKEELGERDLNKTGNRAVLIARLETYERVSVEKKKGSEAKTATKEKSVPKVKAAQAASVPKPKPGPKHKFGPTINKAPTKKLDVYVFGEGSAGELGLGALKHEGKAPIDVRRPRLNHLLKAEEVGVVDLAVGGMHCAALTHDNKILTWGVNDNGALGRETAAGGKMVNIGDGDKEDEDEDDDEDSGLNPNEAEPTEVDAKHFPEGTKFAKLMACDSATFALTADGSVYGWGNFRGNDGDMGFRPDGKKAKQPTPILIPELKKITALASGTNHILALDNKGKVFTFGAGEQNQMGRRTVARHAHAALVPREFGLQRKTIVKLGCGDYNSFCIDKDSNVYAWGLNAFGQTGIDIEQGDNNDTITVPTLVEKLKGYRIKEIEGGAHHTLAVTETGEVLVWGSIQSSQAGMEYDDIDEAVMFRDNESRPRYLKEPVVVADIAGESISCGADHCLVITKDGEAYSWGFSENYQTGQGNLPKVVKATQIKNTAVSGKKLCFVGAGGQYGVLAGEHTV